METNTTRYYRIEKDNNSAQYRVIALKNGYNIIDETFYCDTKEEAGNMIKELLVNDLSISSN